MVLDINAMFESSEQQFSIGGLNSVPDHLRNGGLNSVPDHLRKVDEQDFTPLLISIGPIHRSNSKLQTMKKWKVEFCKFLIQRTNMDLQNLVYEIRVREKAIRSYYAETVVSSISSDDFVTMILLDGMFILVYLVSCSRSSVDIRIPEWMHSFLQSDLVLLENQLPFFVLKVLFEQSNELKEE